MTVEYIFSPGNADEYRVSDDASLPAKQAVVSHNPVHTHTGKGDWTLTIPYNREIDQYVQKKSRVNVKIDGEVRFTGYCKSVRHDGVFTYTTDSGTQSTGEATVIKGDGIAKRLEETRPDDPVTYSNIALEEALGDYWARTPFEFAIIESQNTEIVAQDTVLQDVDPSEQFDPIVPDIPNDKPIKEGAGGLELTQICWTTEAENGTGSFTTVDGTNLADFSNFEAAKLDSGGDDVQISFTTEHSVPDADSQISLRYYVPSDSKLTADIYVDVNGDQENKIERTDFEHPLGWDTIVGIVDGGLSGTNTVTIELRNYKSGVLYADVITPYDERFENNLTFDNTTNSFDALSGPQLYPVQVNQEFEQAEAGFNITELDLSVEESDSETIKELAVSVDDGVSFLTASDTNSATFNITEPTRLARGRVGLGGYQVDETTTPTERDAGNSIVAFEMLADLNDLTVIDELTVSQDHFSNLQTLHNYGSYIYTIRHSADDLRDMRVDVFPRGKLTKPKPDGFDLQENKSVEVQASDYYNTIYLEGAKDENGDRPTFEAQDSDAVNADGREISPGVLRDLDVTTQGGARFRSQSLLRKALVRDAIRGSVTAAPELPYAGYARPVNFGGGEQDQTVEEVRYTESSNNTQAVYDFVDRVDISREITELKQNAREVSDQL